MRSIVPLTSLERLVPYFLAPLMGLGIAVSLYPEFPMVADHTAFLTSGRAALAGLNPYPLSHLPNLNPPITLYAFEAIADLDPRVVFYGLYLISVILFITNIALLWRVYPPRVRPLTAVMWLASLSCFWNTVEVGQIYLFLVIATTGAWLLLRSRRFVPTGLLIGFVVALKPNLAVWPLLLAVSGAWPVALVALVTASVLTAIPIITFGPGVYAQWLAVFPGLDLPMGANGSLVGLAARWQIPQVGLILAVSLVIAAVVVVWYTRPDSIAVSALALVVALLASPIAWPGYTLLLLPIFFARRWSLPSAAAALLLLVPIFTILYEKLSPLGAATIGQIPSLALLLILVSLIDWLPRPTITTKLRPTDIAAVAPLNAPAISGGGLDVEELGDAV